MLFAGPQSFHWLIPTPASIGHLLLMVRLGNSETARFAPPVPATNELAMLAAAGIGIIAAVTDLLAVRLRRPALAGLPLLVLFCVPLTTIANPGWFGEVVVFSLGIAGYLALLSAEGRERVRLWGRVVHTWPGQREPRGPDTRQLRRPADGSASRPWCWRWLCRSSCRACGTASGCSPAMVAAAAAAAMPARCRCPTRWCR